MLAIRSYWILLSLLRTIDSNQHEKISPNGQSMLKFNSGNTQTPSPRYKEKGKHGTRVSLRKGTIPGFETMCVWQSSVHDFPLATTFSSTEVKWQKK